MSGPASSLALREFIVNFNPRLLSQLATWMEFVWGGQRLTKEGFARAVLQAMKRLGRSQRGN